MSEPPEGDASVDLTLCLYSVLSHVPIASLPKISAEIARVTSGCFIATIRSVGGTPTILVDSIEKARHFRHDNRRDQFAIELCNGRHIELSFHLFSVSELRSYFAGLFDIEDLRGLDVFHNRFAPDPRWNPDLALDHQFCDELDRLEEAYATRSGFVERAATSCSWRAGEVWWSKVNRSQPDHRPLGTASPRADALDLCLSFDFAFVRRLSTRFAATSLAARVRTRWLSKVGRKGWPKARFTRTFAGSLCDSRSS
jgi:hypothetical protein